MSAMPESDLSKLLAALDVHRVPGTFVFTSVDPATARRVSPLAMVTEDEGITVVIERAVADLLGLQYEFVGAWLTLAVHSALDSVGLTATVSRALAERGIACNVIAGRHHDHLLVPNDRADEAIACLQRLRSIS
jgi:uncharacterized protein